MITIQHSLSIKSLLCLLLLCSTASLQAVEIADARELGWQLISGSILPDNAFPILTDGGTQYYSCRPVYPGTEPGLIELFKNFRGTVGVENNGLLTCDYLIYVYNSLKYNRDIFSYLSEDHDHILDPFTRLFPDQPIYSGRTAPGIAFEVLSISDSTIPPARVSYTAPGLKESSTTSSQTFFLSDASGDDSPVLISGSSVRCLDNSVRVDIEDDVFCVPRAEYCYMDRPSYFPDPFSEGSASGADAVNSRAVIGVSFADTSPENSPLSEKCFWHQKVSDLPEELTASTSDYLKVLFTLPSLSLPARPTVYSNPTTEITSLSDESKSSDADARAFAVAVTAIGTAATIATVGGIAISIISVCIWHQKQLNRIMNRRVQSITDTFTTDV